MKKPSRTIFNKKTSINDKQESKKARFKKIIPKKINLKKNTPEDSNLPIPKITNENVLEHRSEVLSDAKKFIYPLQHSKHRVVLISVGIAFILFLLFTSYCLVSIYSIKSTNSFTYEISDTIPFPAARAGGRFVSYEEFLFDLRRYMHYFETQQNIDFSTEAGKQQLKEQQKRSLDKVINDAYIKKLAKDNKITISNSDVENEINTLKEFNQLSYNQKNIDIVLQDFYGWNMNDFKRHLKQELLSYKVLYALDKEPMNKANSALQQIKNGVDFAEVAKAVSEDPDAKTSGGDFGTVITVNSKLSAKTLKTLFGLKPGEVSPVITDGNRLMILKVVENNDGKIKASRITFNYRDINDFINDAKSKSKATTYIKF